MSESKIEWTDKTSNPIRLVKEDGSHGGHWCKKISEGCANCYAEEQNQSNYFSFASHLPYSGKPPKDLILDRDILIKWTRIKKPRSIFVCSMTDWCGDWVPMEWRLEMFQAMARSKANFLLLTKRPDILLETVKDIPPASNIRVGISAENQDAWNNRAPYLNAIAAKNWKTMVSFEPLLGCIDIDRFSPADAIAAGFVDSHIVMDNTLASGYQYLKNCWVILGGESGNKARPCELIDISELLYQCQYAGFTCFVKQLGSNFVVRGEKDNLKHKKGGDISEFPESLQVREFPND